MKSFVYNSMAEKILDTNYRPGMTSSSHLASMYGEDFLELVWQNGLVQGGSSGRTRHTPSFIGHSINHSHGLETFDEDTCITKRPSLSSLNSVLDSSHQNSHQSNNQDSCQIDLRFSKSCAHSRPVKNLTREPAATENSHLCTSYSQQCLPSAPLQKPRVVSSSQTPSTNSEKQELVNFSNFSIPAVFLKSTYKGNRATWSTSNYTEKAAVAATRSKAPDHSTVTESTRGSLGFQHQTALTANNSSPVSVVARSEEKPPPDEHSEAVHNSALRIHGSHHQYYDQTSSPAALRAKAKANTNLCNELLLASSSVCSLGASNDPNFCSKKHEDTDDSTYLSDNDEEPEDAVKEMPAREGAGFKRSRNAETHNLSERKRRDKINRKMRTLKELIPNCNKADKASMLDDAIEYLKALKLQLQIMSMGTGLYMPLMMLPAAAHHMNTPNLPQLMGPAGMGFRPGIPCNPSPFPIPPLPSITDNRFHMFGFPNQVPAMPPMPVSHAPFIPMIGKPSISQLLLTTGTVTDLAEHLASSAQLTTQEASVPKNSDLDPKAECATKQEPNQVSRRH